MTDTTGVIVPEKLVRFLLGEDAYDGIHFGECVLGPRGRNMPFWWRSALRKCLAAQPSAGAQAVASVDNGARGGITWKTSVPLASGTLLYATPAQPDTGDVAALREALGRHFWSEATKEPNLLGETMLAWMFPGEDRGCYSTFDLREGFERIEVTDALFTAMWGRQPDSDDREEYLPHISAHYNAQYDVTVAWHWDGDGHLYFSSPVGAASNTDIKCSYDWTNAAALSKPNAQGREG